MDNLKDEDKYIISLEKMRKWLQERLALPRGDLYSLPTSNKRFTDGGQYRLEIPGIQNPEVMMNVYEAADELDLEFHRITETRGIMRKTDKQIEEMIELAKERKIELILSVGPRATYDTTSTVHTSHGVRIGYRLRGMEQVIRGIEDVKRATELGVRGILVYDEGLLWVLNEMRKDDQIPRSTIFKVSAHCGHGNPASFKVLERLGASTINPVRDLQLPMISALRSSVDIPIDIHADNPASSGGHIRTYETPEFVRIGSPVYIKAGPSVWKEHAYIPTPSEIRGAVVQVSLVQQCIKKYYPKAKMLPAASSDLAVPI